MLWGTFTLTHIITLIIAALILVGIYFALRKASQRTQVLVLGLLSFSGIFAIVYNLLRWGEPLAYLPLHLCSINALILPVAVFTRNKTIGNLLLVWCLGALAALVLNYDMTEAKIFSDSFAVYYFPHVMEFGIPLLLFKLGLIKKDPKCIGSTMAISMGIYTLVHFINLGVNSWCIANNFGYGDSVYRANYMFSIAPSNPLVDLFYSIIPCQYWYMYLVLPIVFVYLLIVYAPEIMKRFRNKKCVV